LSETTTTELTQRIVQALDPDGTAKPEVLRSDIVGPQIGAELRKQALYAVLAALWFRAFVRGRGWPPRASALVALVIALVWASVDEVHQSFTSARTAAAGDVLIDGTGAALAVAMGGLGWSVVFEGAADFLLLIAAAGGAFFVAVDLATGVPASVLWVVTPVAMAALAARRWQRRQPQGFEAPPSGP
jgi:hypothetical protein